MLKRDILIETVLLWALENKGQSQTGEPGDKFPQYVKKEKVVHKPSEEFKLKLQLWRIWWSLVLLFMARSEP
jgi:hypothetical protein